MNGLYECLKSVRRLWALAPKLFESADLILLNKFNFSFC